MVEDPVNDDSTENNNDEQVAQRHESFVACLERYGAQGNPSWAKMAEDLSWSVSEVQLYAYKYFAMLCEEEPEKTLKSLSSSPVVNDGDDPEWSLEERILFDTLVARYKPDEGTETAMEISGQPRWKEQVASFIPLKTLAQVNERYETLYRPMNQGSR